ncbi:glutamate racemase [Desulfoprunum benzoelyticum]|uniref:Glutamate racemase n=1 Tax=Desulfoprunum benzoelyticum TaxID=1506996 RepID=A0A840UYB3_9BACT|nr:glutamate racemase [Desulfoprunum benzoelyticum]MBB5347648.1 glutamate racemase [Desulfoprunum benzoelyticum]MBM9529224.1 glutamate racemase [Desulfoprunum benzoelyticum]
MIGIFDSGIGGMTVARAVEQLLPDHSILYLGDIARTPYGTKSAETIIDYSLRNTEFLLQKGSNLIVIACNTASSVATERLRQEFNVPIIEVVTPAVQAVLARSRTGRVGIIGTRATVRSNIYERSITALDPQFKVFSLACPLLVPLVEEGWINKRETKMILRRYLHPLKDKQIDTLVLGCTHYPLLTNLIQPRIGNRVNLVDSSIETAHYLQRFLADHPGIVRKNGDQPATRRYFVTDLTESAQQVAAKIFNRPLELELV